MKCVLIDQNVNGRFNDVSANASGCDRIRIGAETDKAHDTRYVGRYLEVGDKLYSLEVAPDGASVSITPARDVKYGTVKVAADIAAVLFGGENGQFTPRPDNGTIRLPVGRYVLQEWRVERKDDKGNRWALIGRGSTSVTVAEETPVSLDLGEPVFADLTVQQRDADWLFNQRMKGKNGEQITITRNGATADAPKVHIRSSNGAYDKSLALEYG
jgi:hypothetical protein